MLEPGEHCDDGNPDDGDLCPSGDGGRCLYTAPGSLAYGHTALRRVRRRGCWLGWHVVQAAGPELRRGAVHPAQGCDDQDPGCDFAPDPGVCEFRVVACLNVSNGDLAQCAPMPIGEVRVHGPRGAARSAEHAANRAALADALAALRAPADASTDPPHAPPLAAHDVDLCSAPFAVRVALDRLPRRSTNLSVRARGGDDGRLGLSSRLRLTCRR